MQKNKKYWLRGGIIAVIINIILIILLFKNVPLNAYIFSIFGWHSFFFDCGMNNFDNIPFCYPDTRFLVIIVIFGLVLGWLYGLIKSKIIKN